MSAAERLSPCRIGRPRSTARGADSWIWGRPSKRRGSCLPGPRRNPGSTGSSCRIARATSSASSEIHAHGRVRNQPNDERRPFRSVARVIFHVDMDAFYVSVERRENLDLVGKPVIVGADPKGGRGRGVVMAASYEARQLGVRSGMPISMASDLAKPDGLKVVRPEEVNAFLDPLPITRISGVGAKTAAMLERVGVRTIGELARFPGAELKKLMGKNSVWLWAIARGIEELPVEERPDPKSISVERTFDKDVSDWPRIESTIRDVAHNVFLRARAQGATFRTVGIKIRFEGFQTHLRERTLASHVLDEKVLADVCVELAKEFAEGNHRFRLIGVRVTKLQPPKTRQPQLTAFE